MWRQCLYQVVGDECPQELFVPLISMVHSDHILIMTSLVDKKHDQVMISLTRNCLD